jgi:hypothetical protein
MLETGMIRAMLVALLALLSAPAANAEEVQMSYYLRNMLPHAVVIELYSQSRRHVWPGDDKVYLLLEGERKAVQIRCEARERICYGAWINGSAQINWGVGPDNRETCTDCCAICIPKGSGLVELEE